MRLSSLLSTPLLASLATFARAHDGDEDEDHFTLTSTAVFACATGDARSCLTSYCPTRTEDVCAASALLEGVCALGNQPGPTLTDFACPSSINDFVKSLLPTDINSFIPSAVNSHISGNGQNSDSEGSQTGTATQRSGGESTSMGMTAPSQTGAGNRGFKRRAGDAEGVRIFLGVGICVAITVAGLAAFL
ncbi:hypothetical protein K505DRAFT_401419 [Melanomma pulvis-pyrius CBS 109.77]|uniref:Extracellular membrane protein CFEM domain-containing protein n=1 Tax=Melanomma pulvis-pyrius CBS 109.77 TaxID=1314802 RepID=A0A6A6XIE9_9PLEO|nr:hypothetical protein K505DRAFT_401419 [Melanomma pulvis-pyrius CBS 109.77]